MPALDVPPTTPQAVDPAAFKKIIDLGIALSAERNHDRLLESILLGAKDISNADGGTIYLRTDEDRLAFAIIRNDTLGIAMGGTTGKTIPFPPLRMYREEDNQPNHNNVATHVALTGATINIVDAYNAANFDFSGTKAFDQKTGYRSKSFLTVPLTNHKGDVIGVLQLINSRLRNTADVIPFDPELVPLIESLASQAAVALDNQQLIAAQKNLFDSFMTMMAAAVDAKSAYTGGHCQRVPVLTEMLAEAACNETEGPFKDFHLSEEEWYELQIAGGLHDVGKVTTPVHIMDKATKLEKITDRIDEVKVRFELVKRDVEIEQLRRLKADGVDKEAVEKELQAQLKQVADDFAFIAECNVGGEFMADDKIARLKEIAKRQIVLDGKAQQLLSDDEVMNLSIRRGTLNDADRKIINDHIVLTIQMLESLPFPKHLRRVPEIAGGHHEKMDGTGYPKGLTRDQMSVPARMMGIADIYEALTAADRPYKKPKTVSESIKIMSFMKKDHHIDPELFELFLRSGVYKRYAERFLLPEQIDEVDINQYLNKPAPAPAR
ncbi:MAG TPA: HD domain-containing phosphohydrolase [Candidatus Sulfotelmatobacter sp.]|nr:HD domain-containing phosphohydrolase [Candidatus Sulfotelmatobacter sp.]